MQFICCWHKPALSLALSCAALLPLAGNARGEDKPAPKKITYADNVQAIFREKCFACHNADKTSGGLNLTSYGDMMQGGSSGEVIFPGSPGDSYLFSLVTHESEPAMPPKSEKMPAEMLATIRDWIAGGALENAGSVAKIKKPTFDLALSAPVVGKPEGPPPMPGKLLLEPVVQTARATAVTAMASSPWAPVVALGGQKQVLLYHTDTLELLGVLPFPEGVPQSLRFSRNGKLLLAGGGHHAKSGRVVVWDVATGKRVIEVGDEYDTVLAADISSNQKLIALGSPSKIVRVYDTATGEKLYELKKHTDWIYSVAFSPDGVLLATGDRNGGMFIWEAETGREYLALGGHTASVTELSWRPDSNLLASAGEDGIIHLWEMENGRDVKNWRAHNGGTSCVSFGMNNQLATCGRDKTVKTWDQAGKQLKAFAGMTDLPLSVALSHDGKRIVAGDWNGQVLAWDTESAKQLGTLAANPPSIDDRLASVSSRLKELQAGQQKLAATASAAQKRSKQLVDQLAAAKQSVAKQTAALNQAKAAIPVAEKDLAAKKAALDKAKTEAKAKADESSKLAKAAEEAAKAAAEKADDEALKKSAEEAAAAAKKAADEVQATAKTVATREQEFKAAEAAVNTTKGQLTAAAQALDAAGKQVAALEPQIQPAAKAATDAKAAAEKQAAEVKGAEAELQKWKTARAELPAATQQASAK